MPQKWPSTDFQAKFITKPLCSRRPFWKLLFTFLPPCRSVSPVSSS
jgi:hypothetical protein